MPQDRTAIQSITSHGEGHSAKFWQFSFAVYAMIECGYIVINYVTTRSMCSVCVLPVAFYVVHWIVNVVFTGLLWYCLRFFYRQPLWKIIAGNIFIFAVYYFLWLWCSYALLHTGPDWLVGAESARRSFRSLVYGSWFDIGKYVLKLSAFYVLKFYFEYRKAEEQRIRLAVINKDMQLNLLKQQLNPHFYFNTLNNLYGLARSNNARLPDALSQLSNIMRYVITECNQPKVLLARELDFLQSYIALEKLRYEQDTIIEMNVSGHANGQVILPLLLIQFVENAFKHGMKEKSDDNWMKVHIDINHPELLLTVDNSCYGNTSSTGIGINSVYHILDLQYEGRYNLQLLHADNRFSVILKLNLS